MLRTKLFTFLTNRPRLLMALTLVVVATLASGTVAADGVTTMDCPDDWVYC